MIDKAKLFARRGRKAADLIYKIEMAELPKDSPEVCPAFLFIFNQSKKIIPGGIVMRKAGRYFFRVLLLLATTAFLIDCDGGGSGGGGGSGSQRQWTYMVYMGADNNLSEAGLGDINEMETVGSTGAVAVVVQAEFSSQYTPGVPTDTKRIYVENDNDTGSVSLVGTSIGNVNMADPAELTAFIDWAKTNYPAQRYALVIWDHGAGWKAGQLTSPLKGAVQDETSGSFMSLPDLAKGVRDSALHFDLINFDACLMAMYEVAYEFKGLTNYMAFSEETEPGSGDPYDTILTELAGNPAMDGRTLASIIVDKYAASYSANTRESTTKSAVDMSQVDALDTKILKLAADLKADPYGSIAVSGAAGATQEYAYPSNHDIYDLCQYLTSGAYSSSLGTTVKTTAGEIMTLMGSVVVNSKYTGSSTAQSNGLALYLPKPDETNADELTVYSQLACNMTSRTASASGTWGSYIDWLLAGEGGGTATYGTGGFGLYVYWTKPDNTECDSDLDLYVGEPSTSGGTVIYAPWMGQTTPNGYFSPDSAASGSSQEFYLANDQVYKGNYYFLINYWDNGSTCTQAKATIAVYDPNYYGDSAWQVEGTKTLDLSNSYSSGCTTLACIGTYSDWYYLGYSTRAPGSGTFSNDMDFTISGKRSQLIFEYRKGSRLYGIGQ